MLHKNKDTVMEFWDEDVLEKCFRKANTVTTEDFLYTLSCYLGAHGKLWATNSGREALELFLRLAVPSTKKSVLVCSFNCRVVAESIIKAGLTVETFDLSDQSGSIAWDIVGEKLHSKLGAIVIPHFFGVPTDFRSLLKKAKECNVLIIEDCAHTLGGKIGSLTAGTIGDAAIFSFNYDKPISLGEGGALLVNNKKLWPLISIHAPRVSYSIERKELEGFLKYLKKRRDCISSPSLILFDRLTSITWRLIGRSPRKMFDFSGIGPLRSALGIWQIENYDNIVNIRNNNAKYISQCATCKSWKVEKEISPAWLKQKIVPCDITKVRTISQKLARQGLRVGLFNWPQTVDDYLGKTGPENSSYIAQYALDIPIHQYMQQDELDMILTLCCS